MNFIAVMWNLNNNDVNQNLFLHKFNTKTRKTKYHAASYLFYRMTISHSHRWELLMYNRMQWSKATKKNSLSLLILTHSTNEKLSSIKTNNHSIEEEGWLSNLHLIDFHIEYKNEKYVYLVNLVLSLDF